MTLIVFFIIHEQRSSALKEIRFEPMD